MAMTGEYAEFEGFEWDAGNREKNLKHRVHASECEQVFFKRGIHLTQVPPTGCAFRRRFGGKVMGQLPQPVP